MRTGAVATAGVGLVATLLAALALPVSTHEAVRLALYAGTAAAAAGVMCALLLRAARRATVSTHAMLVALTPVGAVAGGALAASHLMLNSTHPTAALGVVLVSAGTVGIVTSLLVSARLRVGSASLITAARQIGGGNLHTPVEQPAVEELAALARELETMQARLERSRARERELADSRRELVAWISHDLRTPLSRVRAIVEALVDGVVTEPGETRAYLEQLRSETKWLGALVADLFELSRIDAGELVLEVQRISVADLVSDVVASFGVIAGAREVALTALPPTANDEVEASTTHLERALGNLLDNALRHTRAGGAVAVAVVRRPSKVAITVEDGCGGANLTALERLIAQPNGTRPDGAGLGLAIAKGLIEAQGGRLTVTRAPRGCQFAIELPLVRSLAGVGLPHSPPLLNRGVPVRRARSPLRPARTKGPCDRA